MSNTNGRSNGIPPSLTSTSYPSVQHKKMDGTLILNESGMTFYSANNNVAVPWSHVVKHQVSPASHSKCLLKVVLLTQAGLTFQLATSSELDRIRRDITNRLTCARRVVAQNNNSATTKKKRLHTEVEEDSNDFSSWDATALAVTRSSLLSSNPTLRAQHSLLVTSSPPTLSEEDFWSTHAISLANEHAKIHGKIRAGKSSLMSSNLKTSVRIKLGVEEMRQIFIMYPAVHAAYEKKVPLELSEEQFWRKYLESEFFYRDRGGRVGSHFTKNNPITKETVDTGDEDGKKEADKKIEDDKEEEDNARAAAIGTDDIFSRLDAELKKAKSINHRPSTVSGDKGSTNSVSSSKKFGIHLANGQFDLAATANTERGTKLLLQSQDLHPQSKSEDSKGSRVIDKYNRHWAMVLNPEDATAGCDLVTVARQSVKHIISNQDDDAKFSGGVGKEMERLVQFADASEEHADHVKGLGDAVDEAGDSLLLFEDLKLKNVEAYSGHVLGKTTAAGGKDVELRKAVYAKITGDRVRTMTSPLLSSGNNRIVAVDNAFPDPSFGRDLLMALTKRMALDAQTEADAARMASSLPEDFKKRLNSYFRRTSELLRHFFGIRHVIEKMGSVTSGEQSQKLQRIVQGMEAVYREMEGMRNDLPQTEVGERMRKMCIPIMEQLDWAFRLQREGSGGAGGFVMVEEFI